MTGITNSASRVLPERLDSGVFVYSMVPWRSCHEVIGCSVVLHACMTRIMAEIR